MDKVSTEAPVKDYEGNLIKKLWADDGIQAAFVRRAEYQLFDSADYFFKVFFFFFLILFYQVRINFFPFFFIFH